MDSASRLNDAAEQGDSAKEAIQVEIDCA